MTDNRKISFVVTNFNRNEMLFRSFSKVINDPRVAEIVISDDCSIPEIFDKIVRHVDELNHEKINLYQNKKNQGCYVNKKIAVSLASEPWVIIADSDNEYGANFLDAIFSEEWDEKKLFAPEFAAPNFDYRAFSGKTFDKSNVNEFIHLPMFETMCNTFNFFINRDEYLKVWDGSIEPITFDSLYFNYCWLAAGNNIKVLEGLQYKHNVHPNSHFQQNVKFAGGIREMILEKIKLLK